MFFMFFVLIAVLALIGVASLVGTGLAWIGALVILPILLFKILFLFMIFGFIGRGFRYRGWDRQRWGRPRPDRAGESVPSSDDRFEEWHRMAHAREEVDSWVEDLPTEPE